MSKQCPICLNRDVGFVQDEIHGGVKINVFRCHECDLDFLETWDNVDHVKSLYEGDNYVFGHNISEDNNQPLKFDEYSIRYDWLKPHLDKDKTLLEIGCGDGKFLRMVRDDVALAEGVELSPPQVEKLRAEGFTCHDVMINEMEAPRQYDVVCMFALLEHVPNVRDFLTSLKGYLHKDSQIFFEVPNLYNPLVSGVDIEEFRNFYYRPVHLYYFTHNSLKLLLNKSGFECTIHTSQQASITNHFHWMHNRARQPNANCMTSVHPPVRVFDKLPMAEILEKVDDYYRHLLEENLMGDLLSAHARLM